MRWRQRVLKILASIVSTALFFRPPKVGHRILTYHSIGQKSYGDTNNLNSISVEDFKIHVATIAEYHCIDLSDTYFPTDEVRVAITFDDGYSNNLHVAAPLLIERNIPFTVFVTSKFVREKEKGFLSVSELKELSSLPGVTIGAHGDTHCDLTLCDDVSLRRELKGSKAYLEDVLGHEIFAMAYPYGKANKRVRTFVEEAEYSLAVSSYFNINSPRRDPLMLGRSIILNGDTADTLNKKIRGYWDWYRFKMTDPLNLNR